MKTSSIAGVAITIMGAATAPAMGQAVGSGQMQIAGRLSTATCDIRAPAPITLRPVAPDAINEGPTGAARLTLLIEGSRACNGAGTLQFHNDGGFINAAGRLINQGEAEGVDIAIRNGDVMLDLNSYSTPIIVPEVGGVTIQSYTAAYHRSVPSEVPSPGSVRTTLQFTFGIN